METHATKCNSTSDLINHLTIKGSFCISSLYTQFPFHIHMQAHTLLGAGASIFAYPGSPQHKPGYLIQFQINFPIFCHCTEAHGSTEHILHVFETSYGSMTLHNASVLKKQQLIVG